MSPPSPPSSLPVPSIPPATGLFTSSQVCAVVQQRITTVHCLPIQAEGVTMSIAGRELHISVTGSAWPRLSPSTLDNGEAIHVEDSD